MVVRWIAIKIGKKNNFKKIGLMPFYFYDKYQKYPIIIDNKDTKSKSKVGFQSFSRGYNEKEIKILEKRNKLTIKETDKIILLELKRLDRTWKKLLIQDRKKELKKRKKNNILLQ
jgi:hypothetical protein